MSHKVPVLLACNDDYGNIDRLHFVEFGGDGEIELECLALRGLAFRMKPGAFFVSGARFEAWHWRSHVGNIYWELFGMDPRGAALFLNYLRNSRRFSIDSGDDDLFRWWESRIEGETWLMSRMEQIAAEWIRL